MAIKEWRSKGCQKYWCTTGLLLLLLLLLVLSFHRPIRRRGEGRCHSDCPMGMRTLMSTRKVQDTVWKGIAPQVSSCAVDLNSHSLFCSVQILLSFFVLPWWWQKIGVAGKEGKRRKATPSYLLRTLRSIQYDTGWVIVALFLCPSSSFTKYQH